jgi:uncharacterized protein YfiM (DUF2279 family)
VRTEDFTKRRIRRKNFEPGVYAAPQPIYANSAVNGAVNGEWAGMEMLLTPAGVAAAAAAGSAAGETTQLDAAVAAVAQL